MPVGGRSKSGPAPEVETLTIHIRAPGTPKPSRDEALIKALVRARRIESGQAKSITDLAEQEGEAAQIG
jgi:hypothetical protein